jgi:hypothetical protein
MLVTLPLLRLFENLPTGYSWHYTINNKEVVAFDYESVKKPEEILLVPNLTYLTI